MSYAPTVLPADTVEDILLDGIVDGFLFGAVAVYTDEQGGAIASALLDDAAVTILADTVFVVSCQTKPIIGASGFAAALAVRDRRLREIAVWPASGNTERIDLVFSLVAPKAATP